MTDDQAILDVLAATEVESSDVAELVTFYHRLLSLIVGQKDTIELDLSTQIGEFDPAEHTEAGIPALQFAWFALTPATFVPWVHRMADVLREQLPDLDVPSDETLLPLAETFYIDGTTEHGPMVDALLHNALAPWLEVAAEQIVPALALEEWQRGYCPVCGGYPDFATIVSDRERRLLCERCRAEWPFPAGVCPFCAETEPDNLGYYASPDDVYRVDVCDSCGFYIKSVDARRYDGLLLPEYERLLTPGLDVLATQEGYARPAGWSDD